MRLDMQSTFWLVTDPGPESTVTDILSRVSMTGFIGMVEGEQVSEKDNPALYDDGVEAERDALARFFAMRLRLAIEKGASPEAMRDAVKVEFRDGEGRLLFDAKVE